MESSTCTPESSVTQNLTSRPSERMGAQSSNLSRRLTANEEIVKVVTTLRSDDLLRGTPMSQVMQHLGSVLKSSQGKAKDYDKSHQVDEIDIFLSHNWSTPRFQKFFALAVKLNSLFATLALWTVGALCMVLTANDALPVFSISEHFHMTGTYCYNSMVLGHVAFVVTLCFGNDFRRVLGFRSPTTFLDKLCIHQTDEELKTQGIRSLAAFLRVSTSMFVVYTDSYLKKLWTVYEVASFLTFREDRSKIVIIPAAQGRRMAIIMTLTVIIVGGCRAPGFLRLSMMQHDGLVDIMWPLATSIAFIIYVVTARAWQREIHDMNTNMRAFCLKDATCFVESDRQLVEDNIFAFMQYAQLVPEMASRERSLAAFDCLVHQELPDAIEASFGRNVLGYDFIVAITAGVALEAMDVAGLRWRAGLAAPLCVAPIIEGATTNLIIIPICYSILAWALGTDMHLQGLDEICLVIRRTIILSPLLVLWLPVHYAHVSLGKWEGDVDNQWAFASMLAYPLLLLPLTYWLYRPPTQAEKRKSDCTPEDNCNGHLQFLSF